MFSHGCAGVFWTESTDAGHRGEGIKVDGPALYFFS